MSSQAYRIPWFLSALCALCLAQGVVPPSITDPPGKLALEASRKLDAWMRYRPGLVRDLFRLRPEAAAAALREAEGYMREYSDAQLALYDGLGSWVDRDIRTMEVLSSTGWNDFLTSRETGYEQELEALRSQEVRLEKELADLKDAQGKEAQSASVILKDQLAQLRLLKDKVGNQLIAMRSAEREDPALSQQTVLKNLKAHQEELKKLRAMEVTTRGHLESYYQYLQAAVGSPAQTQSTLPAGGPAAPTAGQPTSALVQPRSPQQGDQPPTAPDMSSAVPQPRRDPKPAVPAEPNRDTGVARLPDAPSPSSPTSQRPGGPADTGRIESGLPVRAWGRWLDSERSSDYPPRILFEILSVTGDTFKANFQAWFEVTRTVPDVSFNCAGTITDVAIRCAGADYEFVKLIAPPPGVRMVDVASIPSVIQLDGAQGAIRSGNVRVSWSTTRSMRLQSPPPPSPRIPTKAR